MHTSCKTKIEGAVCFCDPDQPGCGNAGQRGLCLIAGETKCVITAHPVRKYIINTSKLVAATLCHFQDPDYQKRKCGKLGPAEAGCQCTESHCNIDMESCQSKNYKI